MLVSGSPMPTPPYLIDNIMPSLEVHLLAGASDAGKTRWLLHFIPDWAAGNAILGQVSHPVPWMYVSADRTERGFHRTCSKMSINPASIPYLPAFGANRKSMREIIGCAAAARVELLVIDGLQKFVEPPHGMPQVQEFLETLSAYCDPSLQFPNGLTFLGTVESPKMKPMEKYDDPRQRVSGVAAWGYYSETVFAIERKSKDAADPIRTLFVCSKQHPRIQIDGTFDPSGHLVF